jgi:hypothetical protein
LDKSGFVELMGDATSARLGVEVNGGQRLSSASRGRFDRPDAILKKFVTRAPIPMIWCWVCAAVLPFGLFFSFSKNARLKRRAWPWYLVCCDAALIVAACYTDPGALVLVIPGLITITILNLKLTKFCDSCGKTIAGRLMKEPVACSRCGADLD